MPVRQHPAAFPPPAYSARRPIYEGGSAPCDPLRPSSRFPTLLTQSPATGPVGWCRPRFAQNERAQAPASAGAVYSSDRCPQKRHPTQYFWTPIGVFYHFRLISMGGVHFYCTRGRFCGHLFVPGFARFFRRALKFHNFFLTNLTSPWTSQNLFSSLRK